MTTRTDQLIATLAADARPVPAAAPRMVAALVAGAFLALFGLILVFGSPAGPIAGRGLVATGMKVGFPLTIAMIAVASALAAGRPGARPAGNLAWLALPLVAASIVAGLDLATVPVAAWGNLLFGTTFVRCLAAVSLGSIPALVGLTLAFRILAPTRPRVAGFLIGLGAGGAAAAAYALYCPEASPAFLIASYTPAMLVPAFAGLLLGPKLLHW